jgi:hypothetical protein
MKMLPNLSTPLIVATLGGLLILYLMVLKGKYDDCFSKRHHRLDKDCDSARGHLAPKLNGLSREKHCKLMSLLSGDAAEVRAAKIWKNKLDVYSGKLIKLHMLILMKKF